MGWFQPGGAGTAIYCYDDADATGGHAAGSPHTWAECNTTFPVDFPRMQDAAGNFFTGGATPPSQYLPKVLVTIGNPAVAGNTTSFVDESDASVYVSGARFAITTANPASTSFVMGTKIGTGTRMSGKNGGTIYMTANTIFRGTVGLYGTTVHTANSLQFLNGTGSGMEVAGCVLQAGISYVLGNSSGVPFLLYNNNLAGTGTGNIITSIAVTEGGNNILAVTGPNTFLSSAASNLVIGSMVLSGSPTTSDIRSNTTLPGWALNDVSWSDTVGIPRVSSASNPVPVSDAIQDFRTFDTKVVDDAGNSLSGIPILITSDADGAILDDTTDADGNLTFTWNPTGVDNVLPVRDYYFDGSGNPLVRDRTYVMAVNTTLGSNPVDPGYHEQFITFEWPGRDRLGTGYATDGGSFHKVLDIIQLTARDPGTQWVERVAP